MINNILRRIACRPLAKHRTIIVGLGNPGFKYKNTRHNAGIWCVDRLMSAHSIAITDKRKHAEFGEGSIEGKSVVLAKSRTFMNDSGHAIQSLTTRYKASPPHLLVVYDDMDLASGHIRLRPNGSAGGHNGMRSIVKATGTSEFPRLRIGIDRPNLPNQNIQHVLSQVTAEEYEKINGALDLALEAIASFLVDGIDSAMDKFNR